MIFLSFKILFYLKEYERKKHKIFNFSFAVNQNNRNFFLKNGSLDLTNKYFKYKESNSYEILTMHCLKFPIIILSLKINISSKYTEKVRIDSLTSIFFQNILIRARNTNRSILTLWNLENLCH